MPFCPKYEAEYNEGIVKCSDCDIPLVDKLPEKPKEKEEEIPYLNEKFEILITENNEFDLLFYNSVLKKNGIESIVNSPKYYGNFNNIGLTSEHHLLVPTSQMEHAREIIKGLKAEKVNPEDIKGWEKAPEVEPEKVLPKKKVKELVDNIYIIIIIICITFIVLYNWRR
ncbi:MAG: hypothetical protein A2452_08830 [Candidatus Firestonebacteria bacterium RIFOXYC2_FULL_39_67]|nr:MAG: hypothetical protein A2536_09670 [Candidatus Firestonebacteria bacterium RIFOXYD2_FULL_39_29]OGF53558.1 MAG: hypothetical protein A2452_08830 [Candidatus Firestonebacteria bacterium RIFOXYC2_FULL_39_67]